MKKILFLFPLFALLAISCEPAEALYGTDSSTRIPLDEAIETLNNTMAVLRPNTKSGASPEINEIFTISKSAFVENAPEEDLVYVVNYADGEGFALLSADRALPDPIIAILDNGSMDQQMKIHFAPQTKSGTDQDTIGYFVEKLLINYLLREGGGGGDDDDEEHPDDEYPEDPGDPWSPYSPGVWIAYSIVNPMVPLLWSQSDEPFNSNYPIYSGTDHRKAGCVPLAVSMILAYHQCPSNLTINNNSINWNLVNQVHRYENGQYNPGYAGYEDVADLVYWVGLGCNMTYLPFNNTFAWPEDAKDFMQFLGFTNATNHLYYDADLIIDMLEDSKPVFIAADIHSWVIDGMIRLYNFDSETRDLFHCNMGWGGKANGYYASRTFKSSKQIYTDSNFGDQTPGDSFNFNTVFRIITY